MYGKYWDLIFWEFVIVLGVQQLAFIVCFGYLFFGWLVGWLGPSNFGSSITPCLHFFPTPIISLVFEWLL